MCKFLDTKKRRSCDVTCPAPLWLCKAVLVSTSNAEPTPKYIVHPQRGHILNISIYRCIVLNKGLNLQIPKVSKQASINAVYNFNMSPYLTSWAADGRRVVKPLRVQRYCIFLIYANFHSTFRSTFLHFSRNRLIRKQIKKRTAETVQLLQKIEICNKKKCARACVYEKKAVPLQPKVAKTRYEQVRNSIFDECDTVVCTTVFHDTASCFSLFATVQSACFLNGVL